MTPLPAPFFESAILFSDKSLCKLWFNSF